MVWQDVNEVGVHTQAGAEDIFLNGQALAGRTEIWDEAGVDTARNQPIALYDKDLCCFRMAVLEWKTLEAFCHDYAKLFS